MRPAERPSELPRIRPAVAADAPALAALEAMAFPHPWTSLQLVSELRQATALGWVAEDAAGTAGYSLFRRVLDEAELLRLAVAPARRRQGLATALVEQGLAALRDGGCAAAFLEVREDNRGAISFYERSGWQRAGRRNRYYPDGTDALLFRRPL